MLPFTWNRKNEGIHVMEAVKLKCQDDFRMPYEDSLDLSYCGLFKIPEKVNDLRGLKRLDLSNNNISKIENLNNLDALETLDLRRNNISKIENLNGLDSLKEVFLQGNPTKHVINGVIFHLCDKPYAPPRMVF